ncbi:ORF110 [Agrotis segetum granulovirus]|uniref:DNA ligase n=1 Tax=Agrotis segetum granulosis virus TaxID=10464 RepID=Q6QXH0_GVAS|nr:DNA ligase [Agrotis segetum granulovirus]AAS82628.1 ORF110 [Agrotis segetum granulovirus]AHN92160.1 DNA ligase [Agrotis segetum granulovirus]AKN63398.1 DNA ligase [Agrotis segetum granulovirus]
MLTRRMSCVTLKMLFSEFADVYDALINLSSLHEIAACINDAQKKIEVGADELQVWLYLLLTFEQKSKINDKHLLTVFCKLQEPNIDRRNLQEAFKVYGVAQTCSSIIKQEQKCTLTMLEAYNFLLELQNMPTKSSALLKHFKSISEKCNVAAMKCIVNLIRNSGRNKKLILKRKNLYLFKQMFGKKNMEEMDAMMEKIYHCKSFECLRKCVPGQPVEPMLAQPCKSFNNIDFKKMCIEIKYDGERIQLHKFDRTITCYKRNLNISSKCDRLVPIIERVLRNVENIILDCELVGESEENYYLVVFDIIYLNGKCLIGKRLEERKRILNQVLEYGEERMFLIQSIISEDKEDVVSYVKTFLKENQVEGVVVKDCNGLYEPKRKKWLKIKKNYFRNVCSADLVVVGGWKKEEHKRIIIYLVATPFYDCKNQKWMFLPVSKVKIAKHNLEHYMTDYSETGCDWLVNNEYLKRLNKIPNMIAKDPFSMPVWEMEGDFIRNAQNLWCCGDIVSDYVSIRLPRFIKVRDDKSFKEASRLLDLKLLCCISNKNSNYTELNNFYLQDNVKIDIL